MLEFSLGNLLFICRSAGKVIIHIHDRVCSPRARVTLMTLLLLVVAASSRTGAEPAGGAAGRLTRCRRASRRRPHPPGGVGYDDEWAGLWAVGAEPLLARALQLASERAPPVSLATAGTACQHLRLNSDKLFLLHQR